LADRKLNIDDVAKLVADFNGGETQANLSKKWGVHPSTIRRYIRQVQPTKVKPAHRVLISRKDKVTLRRILLDFSIPNPDKLISEIDRHFKLSAREEDEQIVIKLGED
jgi:transposase